MRTVWLAENDLIEWVNHRDEKEFRVRGKSRNTEGYSRLETMMFSSEMRKGALLLSLPVLAYGGTCRYASRNERFASDVHQDARLTYSQSQTVRGTKVLRDTRDHISFSYPATYEVDKAAAARWQKEAEAHHTTARNVAWLSDKHNNASISVMIDPAPFDLEYIRKGAPTGMEDWFWLRFTVFGNNKFYFYIGGNQSMLHPDSYYYDLNNTILVFSFDGPYTNGTVPDPAKVGPVEKLVLSSLKAPVNRTSPAPPGTFRYTNEEYGFQLTLNGAWKGYEVSQRHFGNNGITYFAFSVPVQRRNQRKPWLHLPRRMNLIWLGLQSPQTWRERRIRCDCVVNSAPSILNSVTGATVIGRTRTKVFTLEYWDTNRKIRTKYQINRVIESFTLLHGGRPQ